MTEATGRLQDQGRSHHAAPGSRSRPTSAAVLERYRASMRRELATLLDEIDRRGPIAERFKVWDLAFRLATALERLGEVDESPQVVALARSTKAAPKLSKAQRRSLG